MKKFSLVFLLIFFLAATSLKAFSVKFGEGKDFEGLFKPFVYNVTILNYFDNGSTYKYQPLLIFPDFKIISSNFNPYKAKAYAKINDNITVNLELVEQLMNVPPSYIDTYYFHGILAPYQMGFNMDYNGYENMLNQIDNITF